MANEMYFYLEPNKSEKALTEFIISKIDKITKTPSSSVRYQKIIIDVARKLKLPITRFWFHMGEITPYITTCNLCCSESRILEIIRPDLDQTTISKIDEQVKKSSEIFTPNMNSMEIREKQYLLYKNEQYMCLLDIIKLLDYGFSSNQEEVLTLLSKFINLVPKNQLYLDFYDKYFEYVILIKKLVFSRSSINDEQIKESFKDIVDYFTNLEGIRTVQGPLADQVKNKIKELIPSSKYRIITSINELKNCYESREFPELDVDENIDRDAISAVMSIEKLQQ